MRQERTVGGHLYYEPSWSECDRIKTIETRLADGNASHIVTVGDLRLLFSEHTNYRSAEHAAAVLGRIAKAANTITKHHKHGTAHPMLPLAGTILLDCVRQMKNGNYCGVYKVEEVDGRLHMLAYDSNEAFAWMNQ